MMLSSVKTMAAALMLMLCGLCHGQKMDYFSVDVPVMSQSREDRAIGAEKGLLDVLVRVSGSELAREDEAVLAKASKALTYVSQFQFTELGEAFKQEGYSHNLRLQFSERLVRKILTEAGLPIWSINRPKTLVWLVENDDEEGKRLLAFDETHPIYTGMEHLSVYRGLPLTYPLLDFEDQFALGAEKLWELDEAAIIQASERYKADVVLVGKYTELSSGELWSSWQLFHRDKTRVYDLRGDGLEDMGYQAALPVADFLASQYSIDGQESDYFSLYVDNVQNFADYRGLLAELKRLDTVRDFKVDMVEGDRVRLRLKSGANLKQLSSQLSLGRKMEKVAQANDQASLPEWERAELGSPQNPLRYHWQR